MAGRVCEIQKVLLDGINTVCTRQQEQISVSASSSDDMGQIGGGVGRRGWSGREVWGMTVSLQFVAVKSCSHA